MSLILKQEANGSVPTPAAGKGSIFLNVNDQLAVKDSNGVISAFTTISAGSNQIIFANAAGSFLGSANLAFYSTNNALILSGNLTTSNANLGNSVTANYFTGRVYGAANTVVTAAQPNITSLGTLTSLAVTGNVTAGNVYANSGTIGASLLTGTLTTAAQPNITSVGTLTSLDSSGNISAGNILASTGNISGNIFNSLVANGTAPMTVNSQTVVANFNSDLLDGYDTASSATANTIPVRNADGNLTANFFIGNGSQLTGIITSVSNVINGNSNINVEANSNITMSVAGNANVLTVTGTGANVTGTLGVSGNLTAGNISVTGNLGISTLTNGNTTLELVPNGNINLSSAGNANILVVTGTGVNVTGTLNASGNANVGNLGATGVVATTLSGALTTASQPNITSLGTLSSVTVTGNGSFGNILGPHANGNSNINIPAANGNVNITAAGNANVLVVTGTGVNVAGTMNVTGNLTAGNIITGNGSGGNVSGVNYLTANFIAGTLTTAAQPNITSTGTLTSLTVTGNVIAGNVYANSGRLGASLLVGTLTTAAQPNVTSLGTLTSVAVTGNATAGNVYANSGTIGASLLTGTLTTAAQPNITSVGTLTSLAVTGNITSGNADLGNLATANYLAGTLTTAAQPNITSVGTLTSLTSSGNVQANGNLITDTILGRTSGITVTAAGTNTNITLVPNGTGTVDVSSKRITSLATPSASTDAATKQYVDDVAQGLNVHDSVAAATTANLATITSGTITYNNGSNGVGATLTTTGTYTTIDSVNVATSGTRILVKNEANAAHNGIYTYTSSTVITRATDFDTVPEVEAGDFVFVTGGTSYDNTGWVQTATVVTIGTDNIEFTQFSGSGAYTAGTGLTLSGTQFSISNTAVTAASYGNGDRVVSITVNSQGQLTAAANTVITANAGNLTGTTLNSSVVTSSLTSVGTLGSLTVTGTTTSGNFATAGNVTASFYVSNVATGTAPLTVSSTTKVANLNADTVDGYDTATAATANTIVVRDTNGSITANLVTGTLATAAQPNITSVGTLTSLTVSGNGTFGNILGPHANGNSNINIPAANGNVTISSAGNANIVVVTGTGVNVAGTLNVTGNANAGNIGATGGVFTTVTGSLVTAAQPNITSVGTLTSLTVSGNISAGNITGGALANGNSNVSIPSANGNVNISAVGNANILIVTGTGANITGTLNVTGNANAGNIGATGGVFTTVTGSLVTAAQPNITSVGTLTSLAVTGNVTAGNVYANSGTIGASLLTGTLTTAAQPNITSVGTAGALTIGNTSNGGAVFGNTFLIINSGASQTEGAQITLAYKGISGYTSAGNSTWNLDVDTANTFRIYSIDSAGTANVALSVYGNSDASFGAKVTATGNITGGNLVTGGLVSATGNITGAVINATSTTNATSMTTGALIVAGGVGANGNSYMGNTTFKSNVAYVAPNGANTITTQMLNGGTLAWSGNAGQLFSIVDSMTGNIFSVNDVSGIPMITVDANGYINLAPTGGFVAFGVSTGISANGSTQGTATSLTRPINVVSTVSSGQGVILPTAIAGMRIIVMNTSANALSVYPATSGIINSAAANAAFSLSAGARLEFIATTTTQWYTLNSTYA